ncbi:MAG: DUF115 domain-containing protein [Spirochaetes bacterium]|nr:DUF115 domain-containing protein [Spirochaetota bacterium]
MLEYREEVLPAKSGLPTARCNGIFLHSLYDPLREAEQYLRSLSLPSQLKTILVLGSGLGYLERCLCSLYPNTKVLSLQFSTFFDGKVVHSLPPSHCYYPYPHCSLEDFLYKTTEGTDLKDLQILTWNPSFQAYSRMAQTITERVLQVLRQISRSFQTTYVFGRRWILNCVKNFLFHPPKRLLQTIPYPICIAASGPSLSVNLPTLRRFRDRYILLALPSSLTTLKEHGIFPDLGVMTDAGYYATYLMHPFRRNRNAKEPTLPLAFPLTAAFLSPHPSMEPILFSQGTGIERVFIPYFPFPLEYVSPHGTVAGTALELALKITTGPVVFVGLDLSVVGSLEHTRSHPFEELLDVQISRFQGTETPRIRRIWDQYPQKLGSNYRTSPALQTYAEWFQMHSHRWKNRVFRIAPSPVDTGMEEKPSSFLGTFPPVTTPFLRPAAPSLSWKERVQAVKGILSRILQSLPEVDPDIAKAFDLAQVDKGNPLDPRIRLQVALHRIEQALGGVSEF